jgi:ankyrin repeat protein
MADFNKFSSFDVKPISFSPIKKRPDSAKQAWARIEKKGKYCRPAGYTGMKSTYDTHIDQQIEGAKQAYRNRGGSTKDKRHQQHTHATHALMKAADDENVHELRVAIRNGAHVNTVPKEGGLPALHHAVINCHDDYKSIQLLLHKGAKLDLKDANLRTPLACACWCVLITCCYSMHIRSHALLLYPPCRIGHHTVTRLLLSHGSDVNTRSVGGWTPLMWACCHGHPKVVKTLLKHGADATLKSVRGLTALQYAARYNTQHRHAACIQLIERQLGVHSSGFKSAPDLIAHYTKVAGRIGGIEEASRQYDFDIRYGQV